MRQYRYPIYGEAGSAWVLVFDPADRLWFVDEITTAPAGRRRVTLSAFEQTSLGQKLEAKLREAQAKAVHDA